jgi:hypothetical protein
VEYLFFLLFIGLVGGYIVWKYRGMGAGGLARHYGLPAGDGVQYGWSCDFHTEISTAAKAGVAAAGLLLGGIATLRPLGASVALSTQGRLAMVVETEGGGVLRLLFNRGEGLRVEILGPGPRKIQGGPSVIVRFTSADERSLQLLMHHSAASYLQAWTAGPGGPSLPSKVDRR